MTTLSTHVRRASYRCVFDQVRVFGPLRRGFLGRAPVELEEHFPAVVGAQGNVRLYAVDGVVAARDRPDRVPKETPQGSDGVTHLKKWGPIIEKARGIEALGRVRLQPKANDTN